MLDLNPKYLSQVQKLLAKYVPYTIVWAYGSRVTGQAHEGSDLDLVIINPKDPALPQDHLPELRSAFTDSNLPILIDILDWALIPDTFREEIKKAHVVIQ